MTPLFRAFKMIQNINQRRLVDINNAYIFGHICYILGRCICIRIFLSLYFKQDVFVFLSIFLLYLYLYLKHSKEDWRLETTPTHLATSALCGRSNDVSPMSDEIFFFWKLSQFLMDKNDLILYSNISIFHEKLLCVEQWHSKGFVISFFSLSKLVAPRKRIKPPTHLHCHVVSSQ